MIRVFLLLLALTVGSWFLADSLKQKGPGFVWIYFDHYSLETSFWFFCLLLIVLVVSLYLALRLLDIAVFFAFRAGLLPKKWGENRYRIVRSMAETAYSEGDWQGAISGFRKALRKKAEFSMTLMAARAALNARDLAQADEFYELAKDCSDLSELNLGLLQLDIAIARKADGRIKEIISRLQRDFPRNKIVAARAFEFYCKTYRWHQAEAFLSLAKKSQLLAQETLEQYERQLHLGLLKEAAEHHDVKALEKRYKQAKAIDAMKPYLPELEAGYVAGLLNADEQAKADKLAKVLIKQSSFKALSQALDKVSAGKDNHLGSWQDSLKPLASNESTASDTLFELMAKIAERLHDAHQAIDYYEKSLAISYSKSNLLALIKLCLAEEKYEKAKKYMVVLQSAT